jgi:hypothetical protein
MFAPIFDGCRVNNLARSEEFHARRMRMRWNRNFSKWFSLQYGLEDYVMGRYLLLWLLGVPLPILFLIWIIGGLH